jgi:hypothetical protein
LLVQRPVGTAHVWKTVTRLTKNSGSGQLPGVPLGDKYRYRLAAIEGTRVLARDVQGFSIFGQVPFSTLLNEYQNKVLTLAQGTFPYTRYNYGDRSPIIEVNNNNCLSVHIDFVAFEYYNHAAPGTETFTLVQESRDPVSVSVPYNSIGALEAELSPGQSWGLNSSHASPHQGSPTMSYLNGYAICKSTETF